MKILFCEGSSLSAREALTALGLENKYKIFVCDPNPLCLCRFTRFDVKYFKCPSINESIDGYFRRIVEIIQNEKIDVLLPNHEQALLFSNRLEELSKIVKIALPDFENYLQLFSKIKFMELLENLEIPFPTTIFCENAEEIREKIFYPCFLKTDFGTASTGVWKLNNPYDLEAVLGSLKTSENKFLIQGLAVGKMEVGYSLFDKGKLISFYCSQRLREGHNGSSCSKVGVERPIVQEHFRKIGEKLGWHGALAIDYFYTEDTKMPFYIDASPRLVEPMSAFLNGINFPENLIRLSIGESEQIKIQSALAIRTHMLMMSLMFIAAKTNSRVALISDLWTAIFSKGDYENSIEELSNFSHDWLNLFSLFFVIFRLLINPNNADKIAGATVKNYALSLDTIHQIQNEKKL